LAARARRAAFLLLVLWSLTVLAGCASSESSDGEDCTSFYQHVAEARTLSALKARLAHDVDPEARSVRVVGRHDGKTTINVLNRRNGIVMQVDVWQKSNGRWTAARWLQCID
jgi:outer membrane murein-binding lipoprotein Lpp